MARERKRCRESDDVGERAGWRDLFPGGQPGPDGYMVINAATPAPLGTPVMDNDRVQQQSVRHHGQTNQRRRWH